MKVLICLLTLLYITGLQGQNLIPNGSFELIKNTQTSAFIGSGDFDKSIHFWSSPTKGVPSLTSLHKNNAKFTDNFRLPVPTDGKYMLGLFLSGYTETCSDFRESVQVKLKDTLTINEKYVLDFWITSTEVDEYEVGVFLSNEAVYDYKVCHIKEDPHLVFSDSIQRWEWKKVRFEFQAKFPISYIMIGNFKKEKDKDYKFCYFDEFRLMKSGSEPIITPIASSASIPKEKDLPIPDNFTSPNIQFNTGKYDLLPSSYAILDSVAIYLEGNKAINLAIEGHTDLSGNGDSNNLLSINRTNEVKSYLVAKGIAPNRVSCVGYGSSRPISNDVTQSGMEVNRRVVFKFLSEEK